MAIFSLVGIDLIKPERSFLLRPIEQHLNAFFGGLVTISVAAIGFSNKPMLNRTRFWFVIPIIVSAIGFLLKDRLLKNAELQCLLERSDCVHVGFVYSLPELCGIISSKGIKVPSSAL